MNPPILESVLSRVAFHVGNAHKGLGYVCAASFAPATWVAPRRPRMATNS